jgi:hypothetical protein
LCHALTVWHNFKIPGKKNFLMKRTLLLIVTGLLFIIHPAAAQIASAPKDRDTLSKVSVGVKAGVNFNTISGDEVFQQKYTAGITGGAYASVIRKNVGIRIEGLIRPAEYHLQDSIEKDAHFTLISLDIPILFEYQPAPWISVQAGPQFSTLLSVKKHPSDSTDPGTYFQVNDISGVIGIEGKLAKYVSFGVRYIIGLSNIHIDQSTRSMQAWHTSAVQVYAGVKLF